MDNIEFHEHPDYKGNKDSWEKSNDFYIGDQSTMKNYIWWHEFEKNKKASKYREIRLNRTIYNNLIRPFTKRLVGVALSGGITKAPEVVKLLAKYEKNVDGNNSTFDQFVKNFACNYFLHGKSIIIVDATPGKPQTLADEKSSNHRPFMNIVSPLSMPDWQKGQDGSYEAFRQEYKSIATRRTLREAPAEIEKCREYLKRGDTTLINIYEKRSDEWKQVSNVEIDNRPELPIAVAESESWLNQTVDIAHQKLNADSAYSNILNFQAYQRIIATGKVPAKTAGVATEFSITIIDIENGGVQVIDPCDPVALRLWIEQLKMEMVIATFLQDRVVSRDSRAVEGEGTIEASKSNLYDAMEDAIEDIESAVNTSLRHFARFTDVSNDFQGEITINKDLVKDSIDDLIKLGMAAREEMKKVPEWYKAWKLKIAENMDLSNFDEVKEAIENAKAETPGRNNLIDEIVNEQIRGNQEEDQES